METAYLPICLSSSLSSIFFLLLFANISWCLFCSRLKNKETTWKGYAPICGGYYTLIFLNSFIPITNKKIREPSIFYYIRVAVSGNKYQISICSFSPHQSFPYIWASTMAVKENLVNLSQDPGLAYCWISCGQAMPNLTVLPLLWICFPNVNGLMVLLVPWFIFLTILGAVS